MNEQEAQQAQTIAEIKERHGWLVLTYENETQPGDGLQAHEDRAELLAIVDSKAQKIAEARQAAESLRARYTARIAGDSQAKHYERADLLFPWEKP